MKTHRVLIVGGGFGGVYTAQRLEQIFARRKDVEITLISGENFLLFTPMLAEVVSSSIEANHIVSPIRAFFRRVRFQNSDVQFIDFERRVVISSHCPKCGPRELAFDHLDLLDSLVLSNNKSLEVQRQPIRFQTGLCGI